MVDKRYQGIKPSPKLLELVGGDISLAVFCQVAEPLTFDAKKDIIRAGEVSNEIYLLVEGTLQVYLTDKSGRELILTYLNGVNFFGELGLLNLETKRSANVKTRTNCVVYKLGYDEFNVLNISYPILMRRLAEQLASRLKMTSRNINSIIFEDIHLRILRFIANMAAMPDSMSHPKGLQVKTTRQEIAQVVGVSRETVGRAMKVLEEAKIIEPHGKNIILLADYVERRKKLESTIGSH